jgi:hypothetical protein
VNWRLSAHRGISRISEAFAAFELTQISEQKAANHNGMFRRSARADRVNLRSKEKFHLAQYFSRGFAREFSKFMHHVHLIVVPEFMCDIGPRFR